MTEPGRQARRAWCVLLLGIQILAVGVPLADARLESATSARLEIGEPGSRSDVAIHDHLLCTLCHFLSHGETVSTIGPADPPAGEQYVARHAPASGAELPSVHRRPHGRSPPAA